MNPCRFARALALALLFTSLQVAAQDAGVPPPSDPGAAPLDGESPEARLAAARSACIEHIPEGKARPELVETFPERGKAGYAATL
jgi:hypothetical protein